MNRSKFGLLACVLAALFLLTACGSSSSSSSSGGSAPPSSTGAAAPAITGAAIKLGMICSCSGPQVAQLGTTGKAATAWADSVNASGGINGHPVKLFVMDDGQNPATSLQDAKTLVTTDHVIAIVGEVSLVDAAWAKYVTSAGIPVVGGLSPEASFLTNPDFYPSGTQLVVQTAGTIALAKAAGDKHAGVVYCAESPVCAEVVPLTQGAATLSGLKFSSIKVSATAPSYAAPCLSLKSEGVDAMFLADNAPIDQRIMAGCVQQGYKPKLVNEITASARSWLSDPNFDGALLTGTNANPFDASLPAVAQFQAALNKYEPGTLTSAQFTYDDIYPWVGGELFEAAAKAGDITPTSTGADVKKGLYALKNETLNGLSSPLNFTAGKPSFVPCYFTETISGGKFTSSSNNKPTCLPASTVSALLKAL